MRAIERSQIGAFPDIFLRIVINNLEEPIAKVGGVYEDDCAGVEQAVLSGQQGRN